MTKLVGEPINPEKTIFKEFIKTLIEQSADIYIIDWVLHFMDGTTNPIKIFEELKKENFNFLSKYWILYSGPEGNSVSEFINEYFPSSKYYSTPGKGNLEGSITKSGRDHFSEVITVAEKFIESTQVPIEIVELDVDVEETTIRDFSGVIYDVDDINISSSDGRKVAIINRHLFICMGYDKSYGVFLHFDKDNRTLKKLIFRFNDSASPIKRILGERMQEVSRNFLYNPIFFDNFGIVDSSISDYLNLKLENLQAKYQIKGSRFDCDLRKIIKILNEHGIGEKG